MHRDTTSRRLTCGFAALLVCAAVGLLAPAAQAQQPITTASVPTFAGSMLKLDMENPVIRLVPNSTTNYLYQPGGRFRIWTDTVSPTGGDPTRTGDEGRNIASVVVAGLNYPTFTSKVTVAIDTDPTDATQGFYYDVNDLAANDTSSAVTSDLVNYWPVAPTAGSRDITGEFRLPVAFDANNAPTEWVRVRQILTVIGDAVQVEFIVYNSSTTAHTIGLRVMFDALFGGASVQDGTAVILPNGEQITSERMIPDPTKPTEALPARWVSYDDLTDPNVAVRGTITGSEVTNPGVASTSAGLPSNIAWGQLRNIGLTNQFYFTPNSGASLTGEDWGYAVTWNPVTVAAGASRRFVTYYGMGSSAGDYDPPYAFMAYAPFVLNTMAGDDPATTDVVETYHYTDQSNRSPFPLSAYMDNYGTNSLLDASVRIRLPLGLTLAPGQSLTQSAGTIARNVIKNLTWNVYATATRPGQAEVKYTGPRGKVLTRTIEIPAIPVLNPIAGSTNGLEMVSIPYQFSDTDAEWVFQSLGSLLPGGPATILRYDPTMAQYKMFPDSSTTNITPGKGYWLLNSNQDVISLPSDATPVDATTSYSVDVKTGWNQIGNPFTTTLRFDEITVMPESGGEYTLAEAVSRNLLMPTLYSYDPTTNSYAWELNLSDTVMDPYMGYWLLVRKNCTLVFPPPSNVASAATPKLASAAPADAVSDGNWRVNLVVSSPGLNATQQALRVHNGAEQSLDQYDVAQPPATVRNDSVYLKSAFYPSSSGLGTAYLNDARGPIQAPEEWNLVIRTNACNQAVTVAWPSLNQLPRGLVATLVDPVTGQRQYMRTTSGYTFRTGSDVCERALKIIVQPKPASALTVTGVTAAALQRGIVSLAYNLSADANVDVRIRNMAGIVISTPVVGQQAAAGSNNLLWSGQSNRGTAVPSGRYLCEIAARSALTGEAVNVVCPVTIRR